MNFYKRHLGDYAKDAGHLSMIEHGAYTLLLDRYYTTERPIANLTEAYRVCRARSAQEKAAVDAVLAEFFVSDGESFMNRRAEEEIAKAAHQRAVNQELGKRGGRPKRTESKTESVIEHETDSEPTRNPSQTPDSTIQRKKLPPASRVTPSRPDGVDAQVWGDWLALRKAKRAPVTQTTVEGASAEAAKAGMTLEAFLRAWCRRGSQGLEAAWLKPDEKAMSFRERDSELRRAEVARWTGGVLASKPSAEVIEMEAPNAAKRLG